jgi:hypothetical protein
MGLKLVKNDNEKTLGAWISGSELKGKDIERLEKELSAQSCVIDGQRQTIEELRQELNKKKSIVADWLEPPIFSRKYFKGTGGSIWRSGTDI